MISLDSNVLVYASDRAAGARYKIARDIIDIALPINLVLTEQSVIEFLNVAGRKMKLPAAQAALIARVLTNAFPLIFPPTTIVDDVIDLRLRHNLSVWDARLLATCAAHGCSHLLSEDMQDGAIYAGVTVLNPFNAKNALAVAHLLRP